jgi:hypothetical protein
VQVGLATEAIALFLAAYVLGGRWRSIRRAGFPTGSTGAGC